MSNLGPLKQFPIFLDDFLFLFLRSVDVGLEGKVALLYIRMTSIHARFSALFSSFERYF